MTNISTLGRVFTMSVMLWLGARSVSVYLVPLPAFWVQFEANQLLAFSRLFVCFLGFACVRVIIQRVEFQMGHSQSVKWVSNGSQSNQSNESQVWRASNSPNKRTSPVPIFLVHQSEPLFLLSPCPKWRVFASPQFEWLPASFHQLPMHLFSACVAATKSMNGEDASPNNKILRLTHRFFFSNNSSNQTFPS